MVITSMKRMNKHVEDTRDQIINTLQILHECGLSRITKDIAVVCNQDTEILTWDNHVPGRHNAGKSFTTLNQYISIYETGAYHCILFDGSIIRVFFKFRKNILLQESLLYWPSPILIPEEDVDELGIREAVNMYFSDIDMLNSKVAMRSPFRYDFDSSNISEQHPATHVHIQHAECRISAKRPVRFNTFIKFIFANFYPEEYPSIFSDLQPLHYSGYTSFDKAILCL